MAFAEELDDWSKAAPMQLLDVIAELKLKVLSLEAEVLSLKGELKGEKLKVLTSQISSQVGTTETFSSRGLGESRVP